MIETTTTKRKAGSHRCSTCNELATHNAIDQKEVARPAGEWREFAEQTPRLGCAKHPVVAVAYYLDGRVLRVDECKPERVPPTPLSDDHANT